jgi:predicted P-loop ATPase
LTEQTRLERENTRNSYKQSQSDRTPVEWARYYLSYIKVDRAYDYNHRIAVGMCLKAVGEELFQDWCDWYRPHPEFISDSEMWSHWKHANFVKDSSPDAAIAKLGEWSRQDGRIKKDKPVERERVTAVRKKLEQDYVADPEAMLEAANESIDRAIADKDILDEEYLELAHKKLEDPFDNSISNLIQIKKDEIKIAAEKIKNLKSKRVDLRSQVNRMHRDERLKTQREREDEDKETSFAKDLKKIKELLDGRLKYNKLKGHIELDGVVNHFEETRADLTEHTGYANWNTSDESVFKILLAQAKKNSYCPIEQYLESVKDFYTSHTFLDRLAENLYGTVDPLQNLYFKLSLIGAVRRIFEPGCQHPYMLILYSASQRWGKSSSIKELFGLEFSGEGEISMSGADSVMTLHQSWIHEIPEVDQVFRNRDSSVMKDFITRTVDTFRPPYGRAIIQHKRRALLFGTTNHGDFLTDETGNKRYLIIECKKPADFTYLLANRDRIWCAAYDGYLKNVPIELATTAVDETEDRNKEFLSTDAWEETVLTYVQNLTDVSTLEILTHSLKIDIGRITKTEQNRVAKIMRSHGWEYKLKKIGGIPVKRWIKP